MKPADGSFIFSQRRYFFLSYIIQLCAPLPSVIVDLAVLLGSKTHTVNLQKWMDKVMEEKTPKQVFQRPGGTYLDPGIKAKLWCWVRRNMRPPPRVADCGKPFTENYTSTAPPPAPHPHISLIHHYHHEKTGHSDFQSACYLMFSKENMSCLHTACCQLLGGD